VSRSFTTKRSRKQLVSNVQCLVTRLNLMRTPATGDERADVRPRFCCYIEGVPTTWSVFRWKYLFQIIFRYISAGFAPHNCLAHVDTLCMPDFQLVWFKKAKLELRRLFPCQRKIRPFLVELKPHDWRRTVCPTAKFSRRTVVMKNVASRALQVSGVNSNFSVLCLE